MTLVGLVNCFSKKRVNCLKAIINKNFSNTPTRAVNVSVSRSTKITSTDTVYKRTDPIVLNNFNKICNERMLLFNVVSDIKKSKRPLKKSEIANINKEWQEYFLDLIDKAIAKRFK